MLKRVQHDRLVCYILVNLFITLILLCHPEFTTLLVADYKEACKGGYSKSISGSYQLETKASRWQDAETVLNFPYGSGNPLLGFALRSQNFACGALPLSIFSVRLPDSFHSVRPQIRCIP